MTSYLQVQTTVASAADADAIAHALVDAHLAACVHVVGPIRSTYRWRGDVEAADEWLCLIKTRQDLLGAIDVALRSLHAYQTPQIIALPIAWGSADYLAWLDESLRA